jgi:Uma2 family endonuclease
MEIAMNDVAARESTVAPAAMVNGDEPLYEVVYGQRVELPPMSIYAVRMASRLQTYMGSFAEASALGTVVTEALFILDAERDLRRRPDVAFVAADRWPLDRALPEQGDWEVVPDLIVEVISPTDLLQPVMDKILEYFQVGVRQVWVVVPSVRQVHVYNSPTQVRIFTEDSELDGGTLLPNFRLPVGMLFQRTAKA